MSSASGSRAIPEAHLSALARVYALAIQKYQESKEGARPGAPDDAEEAKNDRTAEPNYRP